MPPMPRGRRGSSPLARGLQTGAPNAALQAGIIPARAGFTRGRATGTPGRRDHPRSRGVYGLAPSTDPMRRGSSPLARGLPARWVRVSTARGIIPARAGFTLPGRVARPFRADHPRSRGVYPDLASVILTGRGSSPLARGLPGPWSPIRSRRRIIPARAGFTPDPPRTSAARQDHPRSRGVYGCCFSWGAAASGSSPLARGLPLAPAPARGEPRIIPARAGFTACARHPYERGRDHPRSRGVYDGG